MMTRASSSNPEMERIVKAVLDWLTIRGREDLRFNSDWIASLEVDADHSALLSRLLDGKEPLEHSPPTQMSCPWYDLIEDGYAIVNARFCYHNKEGEGIFEKEHWNLGQSIWFVTGNEGDGWDLKHPRGWTARLTEDEATIIYIKTGKEKQEPGYRVTITGWKEPWIEKPISVVANDDAE